MGSQTGSDLQNSGLGQSCVFTTWTAHEELLGSFKKKKPGTTPGQGLGRTIGWCSCAEQGEGSASPAPSPQALLPPLQNEESRRGQPSGPWPSFLP